MTRKLISLLLVLLFLIPCALGEETAAPDTAGNSAGLIPAPAGEWVSGVMPVMIGDGLAVPSDAVIAAGYILPLYSAPDESAARAYGDTAVCDTGSVTRIFGYMDDWLMVETAVSDDLNRVGWIRLLPEPGSIWSGILNPMVFAGCACKVREATVLTDDPQGSIEPLMTLTPGMELTFLSRWDEWAYVSAADKRGHTVWGFARSSSLDYLTGSDRADVIRHLCGSWFPADSAAEEDLFGGMLRMEMNGDVTDGLGRGWTAAVYDIEDGLVLSLTGAEEQILRLELTLSEEDILTLTDGEHVMRYALQANG